MISGTDSVGSLLTVSTGSWSASISNASYQWKRNGVSISGATSNSYVPTNADYQANLTVTVTASATGYSSATQTSPNFYISGAGPFTVAPTPTISGTLRVGETLGVSTGSWSPAPYGITYQWLRNGINIPGATGTTYTLVGTDYTTTISVQVTASRTGYQTTAKLSVGYYINLQGSFTYTPTPSISGTLKVGQILDASAGTWSPTPTGFSYQWLRGGTPIPGATESTYEVVGDDYQSYISVSVTPVMMGYVTSTKTSYSSYISNKGDLPTPPTPTLAGVYQVGEYLTVAPGKWVAGVKLTIQWYANGLAIAGATGEKYQLLPSEKNKAITIEITGAKFGYNNSTAKAIGTENVKPALPTVLLQENASILTGKNNLFAKATPSFGSSDRIYIWCLFRDGVALDIEASTRGASFVDASGRNISATKSSLGCYTSGSDMRNAQLRVDVTGWSIGKHVVAVTVKDVLGMVSAASTIAVTVAKTAPTVTANWGLINSPVVENFAFSAKSTTHSAEAPVRRWCVAVDGNSVSKFVTSFFKNPQGAGQAGALVLVDGCLSPTSPTMEMALGEFVIDSKMFTNGNHQLTIRVMTEDSEGTTWWSEIANTSLRIKNAYKPAVAWSTVIRKITQIGRDSIVAGTISANIPGTPKRVTLSAQQTDGTWDTFYTGGDSNLFNGSLRLSRNTSVRVEIFDEDDNSVFTEDITMQVSPVVKLAKPKVVLTGSTVSDKIKKTVTITATSPGLSASCVAAYKGGSKAFKMTSGKGVVTFVPSGVGTVTVTCTASGMARSTPVTAKY